MKILVDHCIDWRIKRSLSAHDVKSAQEMGWDELKNGKLLAAAGASFDILLTVDRNIKSEQNLSKLPITVLVLIAKSNRLVDLLVLIPSVETALQECKRGQLIEVSEDGIRLIG